MQLLCLCVLHISTGNTNGTCSLTIESSSNLSFTKNWYFLSESLKEYLFDSLRISEKKNERTDLSSIGMITTRNSEEISRCHSS